MFGEVRKIALAGREMLSRMFVKGRREELLGLFHVRIKLPDKREVGSSTLPRPINFRSLPRKRLGAGGVLLFLEAANENN
jgi:hypothetical protein